MRPVEFQSDCAGNSRAVSVSGLTKRFGSRPAVFEGLDFAVTHREAVAVIGANGTGKSTLMRALVRLTEVDEGVIEVLGEKVRSLETVKLRRLRSRVGFVFQKHNLVQRISALSNVVHGAQARHAGPHVWAQWCAPRHIREEAMHCLARVGLADRPNQRVDSLSGGQSQRVAIARMLMQRPELVIADEPVASLDPKAGAEVMDLLFNLTREAGLTLLFVSHHMDHAQAYADRIVGLGHGKVMIDIPSRTANVDVLKDFFIEPVAA
jgi:phosphonate transport system ATP-binding protein